MYLSEPTNWKKLYLHLNKDKDHIPDSIEKTVDFLLKKHHNCETYLFINIEEQKIQKNDINMVIITNEFAVKYSFGFINYIMLKNKIIDVSSDDRIISFNISEYGKLIVENSYDDLESLIKNDLTIEENKIFELQNCQREKNIVIAYEIFKIANYT